MKALVLVDLQNDFMPGGSLPVPEGGRVISVINALLPYFSLVVATQDWHPKDHMSFAENHPGYRVGDRVEINGVEQILWPAHCVQEASGAAFVAGLDKGRINAIFHKGTDKQVDSYSAFFDNAHLKSTGLDQFLKEKGVDEIFFAGVATDYCVLYSVLDALDLGYSVKVVRDGCQGINLSEGDIDRAFALMEEKGAHILSSEEVLEQ